MDNERRDMLMRGEFAPAAGTYSSLLQAPKANIPLPRIDVRDTQPISSGTSKGNQFKWYLEKPRLFVKGRFCSAGRGWRDYIVEELASTIGLRLGWHVTPQRMCEIKMTTHTDQGSCSLNFLGEDEQFLTFNRLYHLPPYDSCQDIDKYTTSQRITKVIDTYRDKTGIDVREHIWQMVVLDLLVGNTDRHFGNFGVIWNTLANTYRLPPLFDFGLGLFENAPAYPTAEEAEKMWAITAPTKYAEALEIAEIWANIDVTKSVAASDLALLIKWLPFKPFGASQLFVYRTMSQMLDKTMKGQVLDISGLKFPSALAFQYFDSIANLLKIDLTGEGEII